MARRSAFVQPQRKRTDRDLPLRRVTGTVPAIAPVQRAALSDDAPAVGAAILPFSHRLLPTRTALMKVAAL